MTAGIPFADILMFQTFMYFFQFLRQLLYH